MEQLWEAPMSHYESAGGTIYDFAEARKSR
jgi:hypothetical protein